MSTRPFLKPHAVITNGDMSGNITSVITNLQQISKVSYDISWTGAPVGSFAVQVSDTYALNPDGSLANAGNWTTLPLSSSTGTGGTSGNGTIDVEVSALWIKLVYTASSGSGTVNATISGKVM